MGAVTERTHITEFVSSEFMLCPVFFKFVFIQAILKTNVWPSLKAGRLGPHLEPILYIGHKERQEGSRDRSKLTTTYLHPGKLRLRLLVWKITKGSFATVFLAH